MNLLPSQQSCNSIKFHSKFTELTRKKRISSYTLKNDQKMISTIDTLRNQSIKQQQVNWKQFQLELTKQIYNFKMKKAKQIAQIAIQSEIKIPKIMKRIKAKLQNQILKLLQTRIQLFQTYQINNQDINTHKQSAQKLIRSPKQLGSTIQHTFTPKTVQTPGFDFQSTQLKSVNEFSLRSNQFTLGYHKELSSGIGKQINIQQKGKISKGDSLVSEFSLAHGIRNPTSKRIKDRIMNSRKNY